MSAPQPDVSSRVRISPLWIIPLVALAAGIWMVVHSYMTEGPTITIYFETAAGLVEGKTKVRVLNLEVGLVESVVLKKDMTGITATVKLDLEAKSLLREDTQFWVVRARVGTAGVSGLGTLLSGAFIELSPGTGKLGRRAFVGLEQPPLTPLGTPGIRLTLTAQRAASVGPGDPILHRGIKAGRIEAMEFVPESESVRYSVFIDEPYARTITTSTRFWDTSGIAVDASAEGVKLNVGSVESLLIGGAEFGSLPALPPGVPVENGTEFQLYRSYGEILENPFVQRTYYVIEPTGDVGGVLPGAPVTYRGILVGRVERLLLKEMSARTLYSGESSEGRNMPIPVLIYVEPARMDGPDTAESVRQLRAGIEAAIPNGLRATLQVGNILTGKQRVALNFYSDAEPAQMGEFEGYSVIPTIDTGIGQIAQQATALLAKLNALPIEDTVTGATKAIDSADDALGSLDDALKSVGQILDDNETRGVPAELVATLEELRSVLDGVSQDSTLYQDLRSAVDNLNRALENLDRLTRRLSDQPNSLLFSSPAEEDPIPE